MVFNSKQSGLILGAILLSVTGCTQHDPVAASDCDKVVKHAQKVLGDMAPSSQELMASCKQASDSERGCVMAATKKGQLAQCM